MRGFGGHLRCALVHGAFRTGMAVYVALLAGTRLFVRQHRVPEDGRYRLLLTGTFQSENWAAAHLRPLALSDRCASITVVAVTPVPAIDKVHAVAPPGWLVRILGAVPARLLAFAWLALTTRPDVIGGFHLLLNGLAAALLAPIVGARSLYFCVGGPAEILGGGISGENRLFGKLESADSGVERRLLQAVATFDVVVTMGSTAAQFLMRRAIPRAIYVLPGGLGMPTDAAPRPAPVTDLIFVGRLAPIKRVDLFLEVVAQIRNVLPAVRAVIVGGGALRGWLEDRARGLRLGKHVVFAGQQRDVSSWLSSARVFVLTSESEGLSLALLEAMQHGLPAVVPSVGDLGDAVDDGVNGYLVADRAPETFARRIVELLTDSERLARFGAAAREAARRFEITAAVSRWDEILDTLRDGAMTAKPLSGRPGEAAILRAGGRR
jgi:L-malate glycosyltransferase